MQIVAKAGVIEPTLPAKNSEISLRVAQCQLMIWEIFSKAQQKANSCKYQKCVKNMKLAISNLLTTSAAETSHH